MFKYGRISGSTFRESNGIESIFRSHHFPNNQFIKSIILYPGLRYLLSPGNSSSSVIDAEAVRQFGDYAIALGFRQSSAIRAS